MPLLALAAMTGGVANVDNDDIDVFIRKALDDGRTSYTLGFYQPNEDLPAKPEHAKPGQPDVHQISVRVSQPGLSLRYRTSYAVEPPAPAHTSANPVADLVTALNSPADATAIGITVAATRSGDRLDLKATIDLTATFKLSATSYQSMLKNGVVYHRQLTIPPDAVELKLVVGNLASGKIGAVTIPLSELAPLPNPGQK